jgi:TonB-dependent starch-binding outer membrane protein SusC
MSNFYVRFFTLFLISTLSGPLFAQNNVVKGTVSDSETGDLLIGATVSVKNTAVGTTTDTDGFFTINALDGAVLTVNFIGYLPWETSIKGIATYKIELRAKDQLLKETVVIGYGAKSRRDITGSVASISGEGQERKPVARLENLLQGQAAGVQVTQYSGKPGSSLSVRIRGNTSLSAGNEPLYVIDGVLVLNTEGLNPADVASIDVLKDASAAAIYGARAANGVVLITTKQGIPGKPRISFNANSGISQVTRQISMLGATDYIDLINESYINAGQGPRLNAADFTENTNWQNEIFRNGMTDNKQLSVSGGTEKSRYYISANRQNMAGIVRESGFKQTNFRANFTNEIYDGVRVGTNLSVARVAFQNVPDNNRVNQGGVILGALSSPSIIGIYNADGTYTVNPLQAWENPVANLEAPNDVSKTSRLVGNVFLEADILSNLTFKSSFNAETYFNKNDYFLDPFLTQFGRSLGGIGTASTNQELIWITENTLTYKKRLRNHEFSALGGVTAQESRYESTFARAEGFPNGSVTSLNAGSRKIEASSYASQWALLSYLGRISYKFKEKYLADFTLRSDGSSRFGAGNRYAYFPSVSAGWRISEEKFLKSVKMVNDLKLRVSAGTTGNQNIGDFASFGLYSTGSNYNFNGIILPGTRPSTIGNENLKWESTSQFNVGLDFSTFDYRLNFTTDLYQKRTNDLLVNVDLPLSTGFSSGIQNLGSIENKGLELSIRSKNVLRKNFEWSTNFNISFNRNKVVDIGGADKVIYAGSIPENGFSGIVKEGLPLGTFYGYVSEGVNPETGDIVFTDLNMDGKVNDLDRKVIGNANPDAILGLGNTLRFGAFDLDFLFQSTLGNDVLNATRIETEGMFSVKNGTENTLTRWKNPGDISRLPRAVFGDPRQNSRISNRFIEDGSFLKLRSVTLSYHLPTRILARAKIKSLSIYMSGQNLWTRSNYQGFDPEVNREGGNSTAQGIDYGTYPQARTMIGGVQLDF